MKGSANLKRCKKIVLILLCAVSLCNMTACSNKSTTDTATESKTDNKDGVIKDMGEDVKDMGEDVKDGVNDVKDDVTNKK